MNELLANLKKYFNLFNIQYPIEPVETIDTKLIREMIKELVKNEELLYQGLTSEENNSLKVNQALLLEFITKQIDTLLTMSAYLGLSIPLESSLRAIYESKMSNTWTSRQIAKNDKSYLPKRQIGPDLFVVHNVLGGISNSPTFQPFNTITCNNILDNTQCHSYQTIP